MKYVAVLLFLNASLNCFAQKDKTLTWIKPQQGSQILYVSKFSKPNGDNFQDQYIIVPTVAKTLHVEISISNTKNKTLRSPFGVQLVTRNKWLSSKIIEQDGFYKENISLTALDTLAVICIIPPPANDTVKFFISYTVGDTAELEYRNKKPQIVFEKMLELCTTGFINLADYKNNSFSFISYPEGLFAPFNAERNRRFQNVIQYTGKNIKTEPDANAICVEWNKKINTWLKEYFVTDIKKNKTDNKREGLFEEATVYTKRNKDNQVIFIVEVFKELHKNIFTQKESDNYFMTGVRIVQKETHPPKTPQNNFALL